MRRTVIVSLAVLGLTAGAMAKVKVLVDETFESGMGAWTAKVQSLPPPPSVFDDTPILFPAAGTGILGPNTGYPGNNSAGFAANLPAFDGTTVEWLQRQFPNAVPPGTKVIMNLEVDRYVYDSAATGDYQYCNRIYLLTNALYNDPMFGCNGTTDGPDPVTTGDGARTSVWNQETTSGDKLGGVWKHTSWTDATNKVFTSQNGSIEIRLVQFEHPDATSVGDLSNAWDNLHIVLKDFTTGAVLWTLDENFESYASSSALTAVWKPMLRPSEDPNRPANDAPTAFVVNDPLFYPAGANTTRVAGYSSDLAYVDTTSYEWLQMLLPGVMQTGSYAIHFEADRYVYKDLAANPGTQAVGNAVCILTNSLYDNASWDAVGVDPETTNEGFRRTLWNSDAEGAANGAWDHFVFDNTLTTTNGNLELRLLINDKTAGKQTVAWDNIKLWITLPCNAPRFDVDADGDVDMLDFAVFQRCLGTIDNTHDDCRCMSADSNGVIDQSDFPAFEACASGSDVPANPTCDDGLPPPP